MVRQRALASTVDNAALKRLDFHDIRCAGTPLIIPVGWRAFLAFLRGKGSSLGELNLGYNSMDEGGLPALADSHANNSTPKVLNLGHDDKITADWWRSLFTCVEGANFSLCGNDITDEVMADVTCALADNETLEIPTLGKSLSITSLGWSSLSRVLCDKSGAVDIHTSNHNLCYEDPPSIPEDAHFLLQLNQQCSKREAAWEKILWYHFRDGMFNIQDYLSMELWVLPHTVSWMGRDDASRGLLYEILRRLPSLFARGSAAKASGAKRKTARMHEAGPMAC